MTTKKQRPQKTNDEEEMRQIIMKAQRWYFLNWFIRMLNINHFLVWACSFSILLMIALTVLVLIVSMSIVSHFYYCYSTLSIHNSLIRNCLLHCYSLFFIQLKMFENPNYRFTHLMLLKYSIILGVKYQNQQMPVK